MRPGGPDGPVIVFLDSGAFAGFLVRGSPGHAAFVELFRELPARQYTSALVVAETYDGLRGLAADGPGAFEALLQALPDLEILAADFAHTRAVQRKLTAHAETDLSYLGASSLVFLGQHQIPEVWGTDPVLGLEGATIRP